MQNKSTIKDIAKQLGVSTSLVSFVLNGKSKEKRISDEMTAKVLKVAKKMNYTPNYLAKSLRHGKSRTLGLIVADISNPFFANLTRHIEIEAFKYNYHVILGNSDENLSKFSNQLKVLKNGQVDGFIITPPHGSEKEIIELQEQNIPFVIIDRIFNIPNTHSVMIDNHKASYKATERLLANNRKNIALINIIPELIHMKQREDGFLDALKDNGIPINHSIIKHLDFSHQKDVLMEAIKDVIQKQADAILFTTNKLGLMGVECLKELNVDISNKMSVISYDDPIAFKVSYTPISAIVQPIEQMSKDAVRILMNTIENKYNGDIIENIELDVDFIFRASCK